ncbi:MULTISPECIES: NADAR family protein [unclassified Streptomyces]|uniref:NADAR family protein n=1 Tax=unclassified Streptomyces TaxID=2593676 RepID=UPI00224D3BB7|nr:MULTISPECIES: NADAR family protein [unclassified Streptomyces]MCX4829696.1 NADAR family protein [Streptomyces sp. NBC_01016]
MSVVRARLACMEIDSRESLVTALAAGTSVKYLHFWGHTPRKDGSIGASCLSQWWPSPFTVAGVEYATAEHWMMAEKARLFGDAEAERRAIAAGHPAEAKKAGRLVRGFDGAVWERERFGVVVEGSVHKFAADPALREFLVGTGEQVLVEASPMDRVWGIGMAADEAGAADPEAWRGLNLLGFALMAARERLRTP